MSDRTKWSHVKALNSLSSETIWFLEFQNN